jgi:hypothetical protein
MPPNSLHGTPLLSTFGDISGTACAERHGSELYWCVDVDVLGFRSSLPWAMCVENFGSSTMSKINIDITMSLDGFVSATNPTEEEPPGDDGERLHAWHSRPRLCSPRSEFIPESAAEIRARLRRFAPAELSYKGMS